MAHVFLLNSTVVFWPERNVLYAKSDETKRITLSNPATRCLLLLIQQQGQVVERDYFFEHVWYINGAQVTNNTFYQNISLLRRAFKELSLNEELIVTVPKVGIRLEPQLEVLEQKIEEPLSDLFVTPSVTPVNTVTKSLRMRSLCWILAGVVCCVIVAIVTWEAQFDPKLSRYVSLGVGEGCHWYVNQDVLKFDQHQQFIKTNTLDCQSYPWVYLTLYPNFPRISALTCRKQFSRWQDNDCVTHYYFAESRHVGT
ncbi:winged helix-turn-helix domain-containing protein [Citrobacter freundii]|uniref:winged helix-turn-helix domain-containing protein n=1 Tax=Citrobacter freundii TaxID=546 RepID=UPI0015EAA18E|nr:winged helix-turn-helix domain-containing protein [Citrobacter freundii]ELT7648534.1 winged helix-turn-helix domain-containing protein [Citrobacter freundii]MDV1265382.1 winged helix-turn-helix domain-containing protein [Citrobacter freundii]MDV1317540.1 winged helix-turn-helix domain-containing protein [Citrobacter freundii]MEB0346294.1 winged helix-turn-helix domain-containing protein [Citrobacter freundii]MEB0405344.1 winged helix-turn-helix domain-containing protein [Citrobacter freundi